MTLRRFTASPPSSSAARPDAMWRMFVAEIEAEQALVVANRELIISIEQKIQTTLACI